MYLLYGALPEVDLGTFAVVSPLGFLLIDGEYSFVAIWLEHHLPAITVAIAVGHLALW